MTTLQINDTVGAIVRDRPSLSRLFEQAQVDYCCGGKKTLAEACAQRGIDPQAFLVQLEAYGATTPAPETNPSDLSLTELTNHIEQMELEHQETGAALAQLRQLTDHFTPPDWACNTYRAMLDALQTFEQDMHQHIHKENNVLFPRAIALEQAKA